MADGVQRQVAHSESVLEAILFTGTHGDELAPIAGELTENADILDGDVASGDQSHAEQIADPLGILLVILVAFDGGNPLGIGNDDIDGSRFEDVPDGNQYLPVLSIQTSLQLLSRSHCLKSSRPL